jgi:hypothetical protein
MPFPTVALQLRRDRVQREINGFRGTVGSNDEKLRLKLKIALLGRDIFDIKIALINTTNEMRRREKIYVTN